MTRPLHQPSLTTDEAGEACHVWGPDGTAVPGAAAVVGLIDPAFLTEVGWDCSTRLLDPPPEHPLLGSPVCASPGCDHKVTDVGGRCRYCSRPCRDQAQTPLGWLSEQGADPQLCWVSGCQREIPSPTSILCGSHRTHRNKLGLPLTEFLTDPRVRPLPATGPCAVVACTRRRANRRGAYCASHYTRFHHIEKSSPNTDEQLWRRTEPGLEECGTANLRGLPDLVVAQVLLGLQRRTRYGSKTKMETLKWVCDTLRRDQTSSLEQLTAPATAGDRGTFVRELTRHVRQAMLDPEREKTEDVWDLAAFGHGGQLVFTGISQPWLKQAAKRWAADDIPRRRGKPGPVVQTHLNALIRLSESLRAGRDDHGVRPDVLGRADIDRFLQRLAYLTALGQLSDYTRLTICRGVRAVLARIRALGLTRPGSLAEGLGDDFTLTRADMPAEPAAAEPGRDLPATVMTQLCNQLDRLEDITAREVRVAVELAIDTGRRPEEICTLAFGCLTHDANGAPVLIYDNHKANRPGRRLPIATATAELIRNQKTQVRARYPDTPDLELVLLPSTWANPRGTRPISVANLSTRHREWVDALPPLHDVDDTTFDKTKVFPYAYRHSWAQRHADSGVHIDVLRDLMDHDSLEATRRYYRVEEKRRREAVDKVTTLSFDRHGTRIWRDAHALLDSEHARYAVGEIAVPYGTCSEPANVQAGGGACPVRFRCIGCDHYSTTVAHLPDLQAYLDDLLRTRERLTAAMDGVDEWARIDATPSAEEITRIRRLINRIKGDVAALDDTERAQIDDAVAVVRRHRAAHAIPLGIPTIQATTPAPPTTTALDTA
jgi:integrase